MDRPLLCYATEMALKTLGRWSGFRTAVGARCLLSSLLLVACRGAPPAGRPGPDADALARKMQQSVGGEAWRETGAVAWTFAGKNRHLWDRRRGFARVEWGDRAALLDIDGRRGLAYREGMLQKGDEATSLLDEAHAKWTNDAFWLNPVMKAFDPGTVREVVPPRDGRSGLLVRYETGGRTPGDAYLWWLESSGRPESWQMWTSNIPIGGVEASWGGWVTLDTGALVSTEHEMMVFTLRLSEVAGAASLAQLAEGEDPFRPLEACLEAKRCASF